MQQFENVAKSLPTHVKTNTIVLYWWFSDDVTVREKLPNVHMKEKLAQSLVFETK